MARGGRREGAGRKPWGGKYGEATTAIRVPISIAERLPELIAALDTPQSDEVLLQDKLKALLSEWDAKTYTEDYSRNPRKKLAREFWLAVKELID